MNSSFPPGAASEGTRRQVGMNPDAFQRPMPDRHFRSLGRGENHGHIGRTTINPMAPQSHAPAQVHARVHGLFGKKVT